MSPDAPGATPAERREVLARELQGAQQAGWRVPLSGLGRHDGRAPQERPKPPPGPYDGRLGAALADVRRVGREW